MLVDGTIGIVDIAQLDARFVNENQANSITSNMIVNNAITNADILDGTIRIADVDIAQFDARYAGSGVNYGNRYYKQVDGSGGNHYCNAGYYMDGVNYDDNGDDHIEGIYCRRIY